MMVRQDRPVEPPASLHFSSRFVVFLASALAIFLLLTRLGGDWRTAFADVCSPTSSPGIGAGAAPGGTVPSSFTGCLFILSGDGQKGVVNSILPAPLVVEVKNTGDQPMGNVRVTFSITQTPPNATGQVLSPPTGSATVSVDTDTQGKASVTFKLGTKPGEYQVTASVSCETCTIPSVVFKATARPDKVVKGPTNNGNDGQTKTVNTQLDNDFIARVVDPNGNPLESAPVTFAITRTASAVATGQALGLGASGGTSGTLNIADGTVTVLSDGEGLVSVRLTAGTIVGTYEVTATCDCETGQSTTFTATATAGAAASLKMVSGTGQTRAVTQTLDNTLKVLVSDQFNNGVAGREVVYTVTPPAGATGTDINDPVNPAAGVQTSVTITTDAGGLAEASLSLGTRPTTATATYAVEVTSPAPAPALAAVQITATATVGAAVNIAKVPGSDNQSIPVGTTLDDDPVVVVTDAGGNLIENASVTFTITPPSGTGGTGHALTSGTTTDTTLTVTTGTDGRATVTRVTMSNRPGAHTITATLLANNAQAVFTATATVGGPDKLAFTQQTGNGPEDAPLPQHPVVTVQDRLGNTVASATGAITLTLNTVAGLGGATLTCTPNTNQVNAASGVATFAGCTVNQAGTFTVTATSGALTTTSERFSVTPGTATKIAFTAQPVSSSVSGGLVPEPVVALKDAAGNTVSAEGVQITLSLAGGAAGAALKCDANPKATVSGVAAFSNCSVQRVGTSYTLKASVGSLPEVTSNAFDVINGSASRLVFSRQPAGAAAGSNLGTQPQVTLQDAFGNTVTIGEGADFATISLALTGGAGASGTALTCAQANNQTVTVAGVAAFSGCTVNKMAADYTLTATARGLLGITSADSDPFAITAGAPASMAAVGATTFTDVHVGSFVSPFVVEIKDSQGNLLPKVDVTFTITSNPAGSTGDIRPSTSASDTAVTVRTGTTGRASATLRAGTRSSPDNYVVTASSTGLADVPFTVTAVPGDAATIDLTAGTGQSAPIGSDLNPFEVTVRDGFGNPVPNVSISFAFGTLPAGAAGQDLDLNAAGTQASVSRTTDGTGKATTTMKLGDKAGTYPVLVTAGSLAATFNPSARAGTPAQIVNVTGTPQSGTVGTSLTSALSVTVQDASNNAVAGVKVRFTVTNNPAGATGDLDPNTEGDQATIDVDTGADGKAQTGLTLGNRPGTYTVQADALDLTLTNDPATFILTANAGPAAKIVAVSGGDPIQSAVTGSALPAPFVVEVRDALDNPLKDVEVSFVFPAASRPYGSSGHAVNPKTALTDANGRTQTTLTLGDKTGYYKIEARVTGVTAVTFRAASPKPSLTVTPADPVASKTTAYTIKLNLVHRQLTNDTISFEFPDVTPSANFNLAGAALSAETPDYTTVGVDQGNRRITLTRTGADVEPGQAVDITLTGMVNTDRCTWVTAPTTWVNVNSLCPTGGYQVLVRHTRPGTGELSNFNSAAFAIMPPPPTTTAFARLFRSDGITPENGVVVRLSGVQNGTQEVATANAGGTDGVAQFTGVLLESVGVTTRDDAITIGGTDFVGVSKAVSIDAKDPMPAGELGSQTNPVKLILGEPAVKVTVPVSNGTGRTVAIKATVVGTSAGGKKVKSRGSMNLGASATGFFLPIPRGTYQLSFTTGTAGVTITTSTPSNVEITGDTTLEGTVTLTNAPQPLKGLVIETGVTDGQDLGPVANAQVTISRQNSNDVLVSTGGDGAFKTAVEPATYTVAVTHPDFTAFPLATVTVNTDGTQTPSPLEIRASRPGVTITGVLLRGTSPVAGSDITATEEEERGGRTSKKSTGKDGSFSLPVPPNADGAVWNLTASVKGFGTTPAVPVTVFTADVTQNLSLPTVTALKGQVLINDAGAGGASFLLGGVAISADPVTVGGVTPPQPGTTSSASDGRFSLDFQLPSPGEARLQYNVRVVVPGVATQLPLVRVQVDASGKLFDGTGKALTNNTLASGAFRFKTSAITFKFSRGVRGATATATSATAGFPAANSETSGVFGLLGSEFSELVLTVPRPQDGTAVDYALAVAVNGFPAGQVTLSAATVQAPGDATVNVTLPEAQTIVSGKVRDLEGNPIQGADVRVKGTGANASYEQSAATNERGSYSMSVPRSGSYKISARKVPGYDLSGERDFDASKLDDQNFTLGPPIHPLAAVVVRQFTQTEVKGQANLKEGHKLTFTFNKTDGSGKTRSVQSGTDECQDTRAGLPTVNISEDTTIMGTITTNRFGGRIARDNPLPLSKPEPVRYFACVMVDLGEWEVDFTNEVWGNTSSPLIVTTSRKMQVVTLKARWVLGPRYVNGQIVSNEAMVYTIEGSFIILDIPPGALGDGSDPVTVTMGETADAPTTGTAVPGRNAAGQKRAIDIQAVNTALGQKLTRLLVPATLRIEGFTGDYVGYFDETIGDWRAIQSCTRYATGFICSVDHFSRFAVLSPPAAPAPPPAAAPTGGGGGAAPVAPPPTGTVNTGSGGSVSGPAGSPVAGVSVNIPAGATTTPTSLNVNIAVGTVPATVGLPERAVPGSAIFNLDLISAGGVKVTEFAQGLQLTVPYSDTDLRRAGNDVKRLRLFRYDEASKTWEALATTVDEATRTLTAVTTKTSLFALMVEPAPPSNLAGPAGGVVFGLETALSWTNPADTVWYQIQVLPANNDGPAINLVIGDPALVQAARYQVPAPVLGQGNYLMLPGMSYTWRVRTSPLSTQPGSGDKDGGWSQYVGGAFRTSWPTSATITAVSTASGGQVDSLTPALRWANANSSIFYYEVQLSADPAFNVDPAQAVASVYWELVHGGVTSPLNSYQVKEAYKLEPKTTYYWRVRPRVQGDGTPVDWSDTWSFRTP